MTVQAPIDRVTHEVLRAAVLELREHTRARRFSVRLHAGLPGNATVLPCDIAHGSAPARDLALVMLERAMRSGRPWFCWITRPGSPLPHDTDLHWSAAVAWAAEALSVPVELVVVTRYGWYAPRGGVVRTWRRLRRYRPDPDWTAA